MTNQGQRKDRTTVPQTSRGSIDEDMLFEYLHFAAGKRILVYF